MNIAAKGIAPAQRCSDFAHRQWDQYAQVARFNNLSGGSNHLVASTAYTYDSANRLTSLANTLPGTGGPTYSPTYDVAGRVIQFAADGGSSDFTYDHDNQLTAVTTTSGHSAAVPAETFSFDANGNRDATGYTTGTDNRLVTAPAGSGTHAEYLYDHEGNRTQWTLRAANETVLQQIDYTWDYRNRLPCVPFDNRTIFPNRAVPTSLPTPTAH